jgi:hypothetical protein
MTLAGVVALGLTLQALSVTLLLVASREVGRAAASHQALDAEAAWRTAAADGAAAALTALTTIPPGGVRSILIAPHTPEWEVVASVVRAPNGAIGALRLGVVRRAADGTPRAARHGTLILMGEAADTGGIGATDPLL